jgi:NMD protein affecting ribosome stability and mRNA decay
MGKKHKILRTEEDISPLNRELINTVCHKCNFYAEDQEYWEREYECGAYKLVRQMVEEDLITVEKIEDIFTRVDLNPERDLR